MIIDSHLHVWSDDPERYPWAGDGPTQDGSVELLLQTMERHGVDKACLVQSIHYLFDNRYTADCLARYPGRFSGIAVMDRNAPDAVERLERLVTEDGFEGLRMHLSRAEDPAEWAAPSQDPIWRKAEELGACFLSFGRAEQQPAVRTRRQFRVMGRDQHGCAGPVADVHDQFRDPGAGLFVEIAGGLVGEDHPRLVRDRPGDGDPLLLAAGHLGRQVVRPFPDPEGVEQFPRPLDGIAGPRNLERHRHVLQCGQVRQQVERLEDEADVLRTEPREALLVEAGQGGAGDLDGARGRVVESREQAEEGGLSTPRRSPDADDFARGNRQVESAQDGEVAVAAPDRLLKAGRLDHHDGFGSFLLVTRGCIAGRSIRERQRPPEVP